MYVFLFSWFLNVKLKCNAVNVLSSSCSSPQTGRDGSASAMTDSASQKWYKQVSGDVASDSVSHFSFFQRFVGTIVSIFVRAQFPACVWCRCAMKSSVSPCLASGAEKRKCNAMETFSFMPGQMLFHTTVCSCACLLFVWLLGSCRDNEWSRAKCLAYMWFSRRRLGDGEEEERGLLKPGVWCSGLWCHRAASSTHNTFTKETHNIWEPGLSSAGQLLNCIPAFLSRHSRFSISTKPNCSQLRFTDCYKDQLINNR